MRHRDPTQTAKTQPAHDTAPALFGYRLTAFSQSWFVKNGARATGTDWGGISGAFQAAATILKLNANDTVGYHPYIGSNSNVTMTANASHTYFTGALLYEV